MNKVKLLLVVFIFFLIFYYGFLKVEIDDEIKPIYEPEIIDSESVGEKEDIAYDFYSYENQLVFNFVKDKMENGNYGIYTNYLKTKNIHSELPTGEDILSESQGLMLNYYLMENDKESFDKTLIWAEKNLFLNEGIISWIYKKDGALSSSNALIDDLRILGALVDADKKWVDNKYKKYIKTLSSSLLKNNVLNDFPVDSYDTEYKESSTYITTTYIDLDTMKKLIDYDKKWSQVYINSLKISKDAILEGTALVKYQYDVKEKKFYFQNNFDVVQSVYNILHMAEDGQDVSKSLDWILNQWEKNGEIFSLYDGKGKFPISDIRSSAIYSLIARCFYVSGDFDNGDIFLKEALKFQVLDKESEIYGSLGDKHDLSVFSFDNLEFLVTYSYRKMNGG